MIGFPIVLCAYDLVLYCQQKYPKRKIIWDRHIPHGRFYYWNRSNQLRLVENKKEVWSGDWPDIKRRR